MNRLLFPPVLLVLLFAGCRRAADSEIPADRVRLEVFPKTLTKDEIAFDYDLTNELRETIYFICPNPACSGDFRFGVQLPFYELNESSVLSIYGYHAYKPRTEVSDPYEYVLMMLKPGHLYGGHVSLKAPFEANRPYRTGEYKPEVIWSPMIDTFRLTIGYYTCPGAEAQPDRVPPAESESARNNAEETGEFVDVCGTDGWLLVPQHLVTAEAGVAHTGDWPDGPVMDAIRQFPGDAGTRGEK